MKNILFFIHNMADGGAQKVLVQLVNAMDREKFEITVVALFGGGVNQQFLLPHIHYRSVFPRAFRGNNQLQKLFSPRFFHDFCIKEHYDVEISYLEGISSRIVSGCHDPETKLVSWIHCTFRDLAEAASTFRSVGEAQASYGCYDRVIGVASVAAERFKALFPRTNPQVLYNTVDSAQILRLAKEPVPEGVFSPGEITLVSVGSLKEVKAFDRLIRLHARLRREGYPVHTCLLGQGPDEKKLRQLARELGCGETFTFLGYDTNPYRYVARSDLFVCSSLSEGFSTAVTEALIVGTPVCTVEVSGMKEMLGGHDEYGIVTENSEEALYAGVRRLLDDPALLAHYRTQAAIRGRDFSTENTARAVEEMLENL